tara:strand:+ start:287 stop:475 length:189 start_codon:yes stop_codon:yes gene_type:complete
MRGTKAAVASWRASDSDSRVLVRVVESEIAALGRAREARLVMVFKIRALDEPWWGVPRKRIA